jgi:putative transposase
LLWAAPWAFTTIPTLRRWERKGELVPDRKSEGGTRYYDIDRLLGLHDIETDLKKQFNAIKPIEFPWTYNVTKYASQQPFIFLQTAFRRFFNNKSNYPQFKKKGVHDRFYIGNDHIQLDQCNIHIPKLGWIRMREALRFSGKVISATISRTADKWFVSLNVELDQPPVLCLFDGQLWCNCD